MLDDSLPSARVLSELVFAGPDGLAHVRNATTMMAFFSELTPVQIASVQAKSSPTS